MQVRACQYSSTTPNSKLGPLLLKGDLNTGGFWVGVGFGVGVLAVWVAELWGWLGVWVVGLLSSKGDSTIQMQLSDKP